MRPDWVLAEKRAEILRIAEAHGARHVRVFGSVARHDADDKSDLDLLVDLEPGRSLFDLGGLLYDLQELLACSVDVVTANGLRERIRERVLREAVPLCETTANDCSTCAKRSSASRGIPRKVAAHSTMMS